MDYWLHRGYHEKAWKYLLDELQPDLALLQEVSPLQLKPNQKLLFKKNLNAHAYWGTAIYSSYPFVEEINLKITLIV